MPAIADGGGLDALHATRDRPLFAPSRRPPPVAEAPPQDAPPPAPPPAPPALRLSGIILGGDRRIAFVQRSQDAVPSRVSVGSQIDGWTVSAIEGRSITLQSDTRTVTVSLQKRDAANQ